MSEKVAESAPRDDLTFKIELYRDLLHPPLKIYHERLEAALTTQQPGKLQASNRVSKRTRQVGPTFHCEICEQHAIYKAPTNLEVKFNQFSKLTLRDMSDALFQREATVYGSLTGLLAIVKSEQEIFENFVKSLGPKFKQAKLHLPPQWREHVEDSYQRECYKLYGSNSINYRLTTTHTLNLTVASSVLPSIERYGQILAYGSIQKLKLPKLGHQIKKRIEILKFPDAKQPIESNQLKQDSSGGKNTKHDETTSNIPIPVAAESTADADLSQGSDSMEIDGDSDVGVTKDSTVPLQQEDCSLPQPAKITESSSVSSDDKPTLDETPIEQPVTEVQHQSETRKPTTNFKHVKVAISQDLDVFITDVPINQLGGNNSTDLSHEKVIDFLISLKVAECVSDVDSLCYIFSSFPPDFSKHFLFKISVCIQDDKSKYFKISAPLPCSKQTPESIKHEVITQLILKAASKKVVESEVDANISFLEYLNDCGAQLIDRSDSSLDIPTQLKSHIEPMKFTSYLPWINLNSKTLGNKLYSLFSIADTNVIIHSKQPFVVNFDGGLEKAILYLKPQYCYVYGLEVLSDSEYSYLYLKSLLLDCIGAVIVHVDMETMNIVEIQKIFLGEMPKFFSKALALGRLASFFETLHSLREGSFVYNHEIPQPNSVIYEEFDNEHIQVDLCLSAKKEFELSKYTSPVELSSTHLTAWQRHNVRLPLCYNPRRAGTYLCHEFLSKNACSNSRVCAFAHLTKLQLQTELGSAEYERFIEHFEKPKDDKVKGNSKGPSKNKNFGKILDKKHNRSRKRKR